MTTNGLSSRAVLVRFHKRVPNFTVQAMMASAETQTTFNVNDPDMAKVMTRRMPKDFLAEARKIAGDFYNNQHVRLTLPWSDSEDIKQEGGKRLCTNRKASDWMDAVKKAETAFWAAVNEDIKKFPEFVKRCTEGAGDLPDWIADQIQPPSLKEVKEKVAFGWSVEPIPDAPDIRNAGLSDEAVAEMAKAVAARNSMNERKAYNDVLARIIEQTTTIVETMRRHGKVNEETKKTQCFRNTFEKNVADFVETLPGLNLSDDPKLQAIIDEVVEKLGDVDNDDLRADAKARGLLKQTAITIRKTAKEQMKQASTMAF